MDIPAAAAACRDIPVLIHSSYVNEDPWSQSSDILDLAEAHSDIRFCLAHSCRFDRACLARLAALPNCWFDCSAHGIHCDAVLRELPIIAPKNERFPSDYTRPEQVLANLAESYPDRLMWGTDSPFYSYVARHKDSLVSLRSSYAREASCLQALSGDALDRITRGNILEFLNLPDHALP